MTYSEHLRALVLAYSAARPGVSPRRLSGLAGLNNGWVSAFLLSGRAQFDKASAVVEAIRRDCPEGAEGAEVRRLLSAFDALASEKGAA